MSLPGMRQHKHKMKGVQGQDEIDLVKKMNIKSFLRFVSNKNKI